MSSDIRGHKTLHHHHRYLTEFTSCVKVEGPALGSPPIISPMVTVAVKIVQELCESRGGRPGLSVLTSLLVSVDVKIY